VENDKLNVDLPNSTLELARSIANHAETKADSRGKTTLWKVLGRSPTSGTLGAIRDCV
jgi:hypothetical protein